MVLDVVPSAIAMTAQMLKTTKKESKPLMQSSTETQMPSNLRLSRRASMLRAVTARSQDVRRNTASVTKVEFLAPTSAYVKVARTAMEKSKGNSLLHSSTITLKKQKAVT